MKDDFQVHLAEMLEDPEFRTAYEAIMPAYELAGMVIRLRETLHLTQAQLAALAGLTQPQIARIEAAKATPTWATLSRVLAGVGAQVDVRVRNLEGDWTCIPIAVTPGFQPVA